MMVVKMGETRLATLHVRVMQRVKRRTMEGMLACCKGSLECQVKHLRV